MRTVAILIFSLFITLNANSALALTCKSGTADCTQSNNNASDCTALGYTNANAANCTHIYTARLTPLTKAVLLLPTMLIQLLRLPTAPIIP